MSEPQATPEQPKEFKIPVLLCPHCAEDGREEKPFRFILISSLLPETGQLFQMFACQECRKVISVQWTGMYQPDAPGRGIIA